MTTGPLPDALRAALEDYRQVCAEWAEHEHDADYKEAEAYGTGLERVAHAFAAALTAEPVPVLSASEDRHRRGFGCPTCDGIGRTFHHDMPDGSSRAQTCLTCGGTGRST